MNNNAERKAFSDILSKLSSVETNTIGTIKFFDD